MNPPDTIIPEAKRLADEFHELGFPAKEELCRLATSACLAYHKRRLEECGDVGEIVMRLRSTANSTGKVHDLTQDRAIELLQLHAAKEVEKARNKWSVENNPLQRHLENTICLLNNEKAELQKQCEELSTKLLYAEDAAAKGEQARQNAAGMEEEIKELKTLQQDVKPLLTELRQLSEGDCLVRSIVNRMLETFLIKHPELSQ